MKKDILKGAFTVKRYPFPWPRAISAGICASLPIFIGIFLGNFQYGLLAGIGAFSYLYVFNDPYPQRAKKVLFVTLGLSASIGVGTLTASSPLIFSILLGIIGGLGIFIFGALNHPGPSSTFFIIVFSMTSTMRYDPTVAPVRAGLVFIGGMIAWMVAMAGWFFQPHGPETKAVKRVYVELALLMNAVGTEQFNEARARVLSVLKDADKVLLAGYVTWRSSKLFKQLYLLKEMAHSIWADILEISAKGRTKLPSELGETVQVLANSIDGSRQSEPLKILQPETNDPAVNHLFAKIYDADAIMNELISRIDHEIKMIKPTVRRLFLDAFDKNSIVFLLALKYGFVLMFSSLIAFAFEFERSYWIPISCGAVMLGSTIMSTFHRAIQRSLGTTIGIFVAAFILSTKPAAVTVALLIALLNFFTELFIVQNYAFAVAFITPNALLMAESTSRIHNLPYFATARISDVIIGSGIGLIGVLLIGRQSASNRLPHLLAKTIRSQSQYFHMLFSPQKSRSITVESRAQNKMRTNLVNLRTIYNTSLGEITYHKTNLDYFAPAIFSVEQLGSLLSLSAKNSTRPVLPDERLAQFLLVFETMAKTVEEDHLEKKEVPVIKGYSKIQKEIISLQEALQLVRYRLE